jgi:hypothetical protein
MRTRLVDSLHPEHPSASRPIDLADIDGLLNTRPDADREIIRQTVAEFAEVLERPELIDRLEPLLSAPRLPRRRPKKEQ